MSTAVDILLEKNGWPELRYGANGKRETRRVKGPVEGRGAVSTRPPTPQHQKKPEKVTEEVTEEVQKQWRKLVESQVRCARKGSPLLPPHPHAGGRVPSFDFVLKKDPLSSHPAA